MNSYIKTKKRDRWHIILDGKEIGPLCNKEAVLEVVRFLHDLGHPIEKIEAMAKADGFPENKVFFECLDGKLSSSEIESRIRSKRGPSARPVSKRYATEMPFYDRKRNKTCVLRQGWDTSETRDTLKALEELSPTRIRFYEVTD